MLQPTGTHCSPISLPLPRGAALPMYSTSTGLGDAQGGSRRHLSIAPWISALPSFASIGICDRCLPSGVRASSLVSVPILIRSSTAVATTLGGWRRQQLRHRGLDRGSARQRGLHCQAQLLERNAQHLRRLMLLKRQEVGALFKSKSKYLAVSLILNLVTKPMLLQYKIGSACSSQSTGLCAMASSPAVDSHSSWLPAYGRRA